MLASLALGIAACSGGVTGTATPTTTPSSDAPTSAPGNPLASLDPCSLLTQDDLTQLGITVTGPDNTAKSRGCGWQKHGAYSVGIYLNGSQGIETAGVDGATKVNLQSHDAVESQSYGCGVEIAISKTSSVDINVSSGPNDCQTAQTYAQLIEPKLPAQER